MAVEANGRAIRLGVIGLVLDSYATRWGRLSPPLEAAALPDKAKVLAAARSLMAY